jgi:hypothetical protein
MNAMAAKLFSFCAALMLALPPAWCCAAPAEATERPVEECPACAARQQDDAAPASKSCPNDHCECRLKQLAPTAAAKVVPPTVFAALPPVASPSIPTAPVWVAASFLHDSGPPLRLLYCVLRL